MSGGRPWFRILSLVLGFAFLYIPIVSLVVFSFNESRLVTVWGGFSTKWYGPFRGRTMLSGLATAPLVMPEVITGLSLLLLFVTMEQLIGWPAGRGMTTIIIAHITFTMAYVTVIVQSRLAQFDESLEEAAQDLGARPAKVFFLVTLPIISPALLSGWLLAFTLSLDDLVVASFVAGPGSSTLPMVVFSKVRLGVSPDINALATILIAVVAIGVAIAGFVMARQQKIRDRDAQMALAANQQMIESMKKG
jgi:putrescine transport system permease protein